MKKYTSRATKWLAIFSIISALVLLTGIVLLAANSSDIGLQIGLTMLGGLSSILFLSCFFAEKSRYLTIDDDKIVLPRGVSIDEKMSLRKTVVNTGDIISVESKLYKGDGLNSKDTYFHTLRLKSGTKITFTLYAFGKEAEKEITEAIKKSIS